MELTLLIKLIAGAWLSYLLANGYVPFWDVLQEWIVRKTFGTRLNRVSNLVECPKCIGFWVGIAFVLLPIPPVVSLALIVSLMASMFNRHA